MTDTAPLTGQDIGEAEGAMTALLERALAPSGRSRAEYITLRLLAARAPFRHAAELRDFLAGQRQLGLDRAEAATMVDRLRADGLITTEPAEPAERVEPVEPVEPVERVEPVELTVDGRALLEELAAAIAPVTRQVFAGLNPQDLAVAHRVLVELIQRAQTMTSAA